MAYFLIGLAATLLAATPARADPIITPIITALLGPELFGAPLIAFGGVTLTVGGLVVGLVTTAVGDHLFLKVRR